MVPAYQQGVVESLPPDSWFGYTQVNSVVAGFE